MRLTLFLSMLFAALAPGAVMTGWISDSLCGAGNANAKKESRDCAERCIKGGAAPVLVTDGDNKVYKIAGNVKLDSYLQHRVQITGEVEGETLKVKTIKAAE